LLASLKRHHDKQLGSGSRREFLALRRKQLEEICDAQQLLHPRRKVHQLQHAESSFYRGYFETHNGSEAGTVQIFEICEIKRDLAPAQNQRLYKIAELIHVFADQPTMAPDGCNNKTLLFILDVLDLVVETSSGCSRHIISPVESANSNFPVFEESC
jgi:hypothetical protein